MPYKFSRCIAMQHPAEKQVLEFYRNVIGLEVVGEGPDGVELNADPYRLFLDGREPRELIMELIVPDLEKAREELVAAGCRVIRWEGKGKCCYIRDPFGQLFNIWEDPDAFK
ncbi:MAG: VOC family protein [candidate division Zixibacteria bacterium]